MDGDELKELVGDFYRGAGRMNGFYIISPEGTEDRLFEPCWYQADFEDPETNISSEIVECHYEFARHDYLGSISIRHAGLVVYNALVNRNNYSDHANRQFSLDETWMKALSMVIDQCR